ncbi:hypothetical protein EDB86DRAFT_804742 [Lactarius hatsudake]|nr:hypothetical protein EDB86DRAFT_804742 [Lactarius hatsudake]
MLFIVKTVHLKLPSLRRSYQPRPRISSSWRKTSMVHSVAVGSQYDSIVFAFHPYGTRCFLDSAVCSHPVVLTNTAGPKHSHPPVSSSPRLARFSTCAFSPCAITMPSPSGTRPTPRSWNPGHWHHFDLLYRNGTHSSSQIQGLLHALAQVSAAEPNKVYSLRPVLIMIPFGKTICSNLGWW